MLYSIWKMIHNIALIGLVAENAFDTVLTVPIGPSYANNLNTFIIKNQTPYRHMYQYMYPMYMHVKERALHCWERSEICPLRAFPSFFLDIVTSTQDSRGVEAPSFES